MIMPVTIQADDDRCREAQSFEVAVLAFQSVDSNRQLHSPLLHFYLIDFATAFAGTTSTVPCRICFAGSAISAERLVQVFKSGLVARQ